MAKKRWEPGNAISKKIAGWTYYARLLEFPWVAFYHYRTKKLVTDLDEITKKDVLFTIATHKSLVANGEWTSISHRRVREIAPAACDGHPGHVADPTTGPHSGPGASSI